MLKKFVGYYRPYRLLFSADILCAIVVAAIDLVFPQVLRYITTDLIANAGSDFVRIIIYISVGLLGLYVLRYFCQYFITSWGHIMGARMEADMRKELFYHYQRLSFSYYDKNNTGEMLSKLVTDLFDISELAHHGPENILISLLKIVGSFILLVRINLYITLILVGVVAVMVAFSLWQNRQMHKVFTDNRKKIATVNSRVQDSLLGIKVIKSFAQEQVEHRKFDEANEAFLSTKNTSYKAMGTYHSVNSFFQGLLYVAALLAGGVFFVRGDLTAINFAMYFLYIGIFISPIEMLINFTEMFQRGYSGFKRFAEVVDTAPEIEDMDNAIELIVDEGSVEYRDVVFSYNEEESVLNGVSFRIERGQTVALVGPSGGGKTTVCSLLPRFYNATSGVILIDGKDISTFSLKSLRESIGIVQQDVYIFSGSIRDNIAYGKKDATEEEIHEAARNANIEDFILSLPGGYDTYVGERGTRLSGGQKQRISIARVFLKNPPILILDEATSALDNESERHIQEALDMLSKDRTTLVIAHRLSTIKHADMIYVIDEGKILEQGNHSALMEKNGLYARYYNMQFETDA